ncbi:MAG TPA: alpha/beta hydrolase-fold protein [Burkholderiaceae bacterium]
MIPTGLCRWAALILIGANCANAASSATTAPYVLDGTEVRSVRAERLQRDYELFIGLPASYGLSDRRYPVLFVTDANYAFPLLRSIARRVGDGGRGLEEFILVGLSYAKGDTPEYSRRRDYTPTVRADAGSLSSDKPGALPAFGQAEAYRQFVADVVFPFVANNYRADMTRKVFAGHSYGGLFGVHVLLTEPTMFQYYILGSPSLWYDDKVMFSRERSYAATHRDLKANVFLAVGSLEAGNKASRGAGGRREDDIVEDVRAFERVLKSHGYPGLHVQSRVFADEDHLTVGPAILTRGLMWALPGKRLGD